MGDQAGTRRGRKEWPSTPARRVWALNAVLVCAAAWLVATSTSHHTEPLVDGVPVPMWVLAVLFFLAEVFVVHIVFRSEAYSFSVSEVPLALGLFFVPGPVLVLAQLIGSTAALVLHRRQPPLKLVFNVAHMVLETALCVAVFRALGPGSDPASARAVLVTLATCAVAGLPALVLISTAISLYEGAVNVPKLVRSGAGNVVASLTNGSIALTAVVLIAERPVLAWLLVAPVIVLFLAYRAVTLSRDKQDSLEFLYEASRILHQGSTLETPMVELLQLARAMFHANVAELRLVSSDGATLLTRVGPGEQVRKLEPTDEPMATASPQAMVGTLEGEQRILGTIVVAKPGEVQRRFTRRQHQLFETFVNHVAVALENGLLEASVAELTALKEELRYQAYHDDLTGLGNRSLFVSELEQVAPGGGSTVSVVFLDLDDFKTVNDTLGHAAGDELLVRTAERLRGCLRPGDVAARLGGDEFAVLVTGVRAEEHAVRLAERLLRAFAEPVLVKGHLVSVGASAGVATAGSGGAGELLRDADVAMYTAKMRGRNRCEVFEPAMQHVVAARHAVRADLERALERGEFVVHYQPIVELGSGLIVGAEALVRWHHPKKGTLAPGEFLPHAEDLGLIGAIDRVVLATACADAARWQRAHPRPRPVMVSVNVSTRELERAGFVGHSISIVRNSGVAPGSVLLEITETAMAEDAVAASSALHALKAIGVRVAVDDFGTGYSSLSRLDESAIDVLKLAKPFVDALGSDRNRPALAQAVVELGQALGLEVIAEGVEEFDQLLALRAMGCRLAQGFALSRPVDATAMSALLAVGHVPVPAVPLGTLS